MSKTMRPCGCWRHSSSVRMIAAHPCTAATASWSSADSHFAVAVAIECSSAPAAYRAMMRDGRPTVGIHRGDGSSDRRRTDSDPPTGCPRWSSRGTRHRRASLRIRSSPPPRPPHSPSPGRARLRPAGQALHLPLRAAPTRLRRPLRPATGWGESGRYRRAPRQCRFASRRGRRSARYVVRPCTDDAAFAHRRLERVTSGASPSGRQRPTPGSTCRGTCDRVRPPPRGSIGCRRGRAGARQSVCG